MAIQVAATLRKIAFPVFKQYGFSFSEQESSRNEWTFSKAVDGVTQYISISKNTHTPSTITLFLSTTRERMGITGKHLADRHEDGWEYDDQESLVRVLSEIVQIAVEKGIPWFEYSAAVIPTIPEATARKVETSYEQLVEVFCRESGLQVGQPESIGQLQQVIRQYKESTEGFDWSFIAKAAAFFGEHVRHSFGGVWKWDDKFSEPYVIAIGGRDGMYTHPLFHVVKYWCNPYKRLLAQFWYLENTLMYNFPFDERLK